MSCSRSDLKYIQETYKHLFITTCLRSMMGRYCFHRCLSVNICGGGVPHLRSGWGVPRPRSGWGIPCPRSGLVGGGTCPRSRGYPIPGLDGGGVPPARSGWWEGTLGTPLSRSGWWGVPWVPPASTGWWGYPGYPLPWPGLDGGGYPHQDWMGYPPSPLDRAA